MRKPFVVLAAALAALSFAPAGAAPKIVVSHAFTLRGEPKYKAGFTHFDYANPAAPKGGDIVLHSVGTFDNFHRYAQRGTAEDSEPIYDTLMTPSADETGVLYGLIAEKVEYPDDYSWLILHLNPKARHQDGKRITSADVVFTFDVFMEKGVPTFKQWYEGAKFEALDELRVRIVPAKPDRETLHSLCDLPVFPKHFWSGKDFSEPLTTPPLGSGPYRIKDYKVGQYVVYERVKDYWAAELPVNKGRRNFESIRYDYYRDDTVAFEAFKAGEYDLRVEGVALNWATGYTGPVFDSGRVVKEEIPHEMPQGMAAFVFNTTRPIFADRRVREAVGYLFDFEWMNRNLFYGQYTRTRSYFQNTEYEAKGLPGPEELRILENIRDKVPPEVFAKAYAPPVSDGTGNLRTQTRAALSLLSAAGWKLRDGKLTNAEGAPFEFELLMFASPSYERFAVPFQKSLERVGIKMSIRSVDLTQINARLRERDYDLLANGYSAHAYPDTNLALPWHSEYFDSSYNQAGVKDPAIDYLIDGIIERQEDGEALLHWGRALDRVLQWNFFVVPWWHQALFRVASVNKFSRPATMPKYSLGFDTWWIDPKKEAALRALPGAKGKR